MKTIGIMGALPDEVAQLAAALENPASEEYAGVTYHTGTRNGLRLVVCCAGMGKANAAATTQALITKYGAEAILFSGIAGNACDDIGIGDVVVGSSVVYHDAEDRMLAQSAPFCAEYVCHPALVQAAEAACRAQTVRFVTGKIATGVQFVGDSATKNRIIAACQPLCFEMEGAAVGQIALKNGVPFVVLRAMSDNSDQSVESLGAEEFDIRAYADTAAAITLAALDALQANGGFDGGLDGYLDGDGA